MSLQSLAKRKLVIADDDSDSRTMLAFLLEQEGWEVREAKDGKEALEQVLAQQPDLLILDNRMPELTGAEVYQNLQARGIKLAVVLVTAYNQVDELASSLGISYFVNKPYDIKKLLTTIESAYENSPSS
ncbi:MULTISPECIES: response regulator [unclassified Tolypothrix]|uniref:response regulator n=1 Tax=unclassified Tolypothrix TaxID=2649714 RepID=UPI0005EAB01A|nr:MULTISPECIES: response regulator [unclassified Tolypothrix]BAY88088.1 response regulator receiver domain protein [Microchaete diplosiphon NIES-3275]EKE97506.1 response regulator [Tolypothrix sp. PCC 7601]MBE9086991.1 response regulator [Tolypothrix sp. LEGE 11397]UYD28802.1 response regulator [Tolypothrix sp. PCC 7712]UYD35287.1 response regulator [Tolypothrix sp. PCC 7601]